MHYDVFNGDADGLCALLQLRLAEPIESTLITGVKRDIELLKRVTVHKNDVITVLDISLKKNRLELDRVLMKGATVLYIDHHETGEIPKHSNLTTFINTDSLTCTSLLVDNYLKGKFSAWAVTAAFGDNLISSAEQLGKKLALNAKQFKKLQDLGNCINYNSYGSSISDLHFNPIDLYHQLISYKSPFDFIVDKSIIYEQLLSGYAEDMASARQIKPEYETKAVSVYILPDIAWARRISGVFCNELANQSPERAHAVLTYNILDGYQVSVRAPLSIKTGADELCALFTSGGGRKSAAGINYLPFKELEFFMAVFSDKYKQLLS